MSPIISDIQVVLMSAFIGVVIAYARYVHNLKERVAVLEESIKDLKQEMERTTEDIEKTFDNIQKRLDSHSKKYDAILERIGSMEKELLKETSSVKVNISELRSELRGFRDLFLGGKNLSIDKK